MNHKDIEPVTPGFMDKPPCYDIQCKRMEERKAAMERRLSAQPSPGASPTEDGLIEKALRVMGADYPQYDNRWFLHRTKHAVSSELKNEWHKALFIHEAKLYLRELGSNSFTVHHLDSGRGYVLLWYGNMHKAMFDASGPTEEIAYARAVLAASGQEIGQAETQAPSTTSHQTENGAGLEKGGE